MIEKLNLKQKIIIGILGAIFAIGIGIYGFATMQPQEDEINVNDFIQNQEENIEEEVVEAKKIVVHITGEVNKTGIVILDEGARIADAIKAAGGTTKEADLDEINLAYVLEDGQKIYIPNKKDKETNNEKVYITNGIGNNDIKDNRKGANKKVNINEANQEELETLPGIGPSIANSILEYRKENGKFNAVEDIQNVKGIGDAKFSKIKEYITAK